jgi:hypothetical protein
MPDGYLSGRVSMTVVRLITFSAAASIVLSSLVSGQDHEKKIQRSELPPAVQKAVVEQSQGATIRGFSREKEKGQTFYEAELLANGLSRDVLMDKDGKVVEVEEQVPLESLSPEVRQGLQAKARKGKLVKVESLTKGGKLVAYEARVSTNGKRSEVQVGPDGKPLAHEE